MISSSGSSERGDCLVRAEDDGRGHFALHGKTRAVYGAAIRAEADALRAAWGARDVSLSIDDGGALPFALAARIEAALAALRPPPPAAPAIPRAPPRGRRRTRLYLPGNTPRFMINAALHGPDAVILDLEDAVAPERKAEARWLVRAALRSVDFGRSEVMVRINPLPAGDADLRALAGHPPHAVLLPKTESAAQVAALRAACAEHGLGQPVLIALIESARGVLAAPDIAAAPGVGAIAIGMEDYTADLGVPRTAGGDEAAWALGMLANAARASGVMALASVFSDVDDAAGLAAYARRMRGLGFDGVGCVHPRQIAAVHAAFAPGAAETAHARAVIAAAETAAARGEAVTRLDGRMIDAPVLARARRVLEDAHG